MYSIDYRRMTRYVANLIRQLAKPSFDYTAHMMQKARDNNFQRKYIFKPLGKSNYYIIKTIYI